MYINSCIINNSKINRSILNRKYLEKETIIVDTPTQPLVIMPIPYFPNFKRINSNKRNKIDFSKIQDLNIKNFRHLNNFLISGATFEYRSEADYKKLNEAGITAMIDFRNKDTSVIKSKYLALFI